MQASTRAMSASWLLRPGGQCHNQMPVTCLMGCSCPFLSPPCRHVVPVSVPDLFLIFFVCQKGKCRWGTCVWLTNGGLPSAHCIVLHFPVRHFWGQAQAFVPWSACRCPTLYVLLCCAGHAGCPGPHQGLCPGCHSSGLPVVCELASVHGAADQQSGSQGPGSVAGGTLGALGYGRVKVGHKGQGEQWAFQGALAVR